MIIGIGTSTIRHLTPFLYIDIPYSLNQTINIGWRDLTLTF